MDEIPVFMVKASDPFACAVIQCWIAIADSHKVKGARTVTTEKVDGARKRLREFRAWQQKYGTKVPD